MNGLNASYLEELKKRAKTSHVYRDFQLTGLEIAGILSDRSHKSLYIKLAKQYGARTLLPIAKSVAEKKDIKNPGAYFMKLVSILPHPPLKKSHASRHLRSK